MHEKSFRTTLIRLYTKRSSIVIWIPHDQQTVNGNRMWLFTKCQNFRLKSHRNESEQAVVKSVLTNRKELLCLVRLVGNHLI